MEKNTHRKTEETEAVEDGPKNLGLSPPQNIHGLVSHREHRYLTGPEV